MRAVFPPLIVHLCLLISIWVFYSLSGGESPPGNWHAYKHWPPDAETPGWLSPLANWDPSHYLHLAQSGYTPDNPSNAFYPLWPLILRIGLTGGVADIVAGSLLATVLSFLAVVALHELSEARFGRPTADRVGWLIYSAPCAHVFNVPYSESLCLLLLVGVFWFWDRGQLILACTLAFLVSLARPVGAFIVPALFVEGWFGAHRAKPLSKALPLFPVLGYGTYLAMMYLSTGNAFDGIQAQKFYANHPSLGNAVDLSGLADSLILTKWDLESTHSILDRVMFVLVLVTLPMVWRIRPSWFWWVIAAAIIPAATNWFLSFRRFELLLFPVFVAWARWFEMGNSRWAWWYTLLLSFILQAVMTYRFLSFNWAG